MLSRKQYRKGLEFGFFADIFLYILAFIFGGAIGFGVYGAACLLTYFALLTLFDRARGYSRETASGEDIGEGGFWYGFFLSLPISLLYLFCVLALLGGD